MLSIVRAAGVSPLPLDAACWDCSAGLSQVSRLGSLPQGPPGGLAASALRELETQSPEKPGLCAGGLPVFPFLSCAVERHLNGSINKKEVTSR